jgi:hypothetical protein
MKININQKVRVKFTRQGKDAALRTSCTMRQFESGEFLFWELAELFGKYMHFGGEELFEGGVIEILEGE